jgi:hypothetical protein
MFVRDQPVPITEGSNTICIREKMSFGTKAACQDALADVSQREGGKAGLALRFGAYQAALLQHNILSWSGPAFDGVSCTPENIARLDPDEPLVQRVLEAIVERNPLQTQKEAGAQKKGTTSAGAPPSEG